MDYLMLKWLHILGAIFLFGTGLGSAFYKLFTDRSGEVTAIAVTNRLVVRADWIFAATTIVLQPITGFAMMHMAGWSVGAWQAETPDSSTAFGVRIQPIDAWI